MIEAAKLFGSAVVGLIVGLASVLVFEPIKREQELKRLTKIAQTALYDELGRALELLHFASAHPSRSKAIENLSFAEFDYYYERQREIMYRVPYWNAIVDLVRELREKSKTPPTDIVPRSTIISSMMDSFWSRRSEDTEFRSLLDEGRKNACKSLTAFNSEFARWQSELMKNHL